LGVVLGSVLGGCATSGAVHTLEVCNQNVGASALPPPKLPGFGQTPIPVSVVNVNQVGRFLVPHTTVDQEVLRFGHGCASGVVIEGFSHSGLKILRTAFSMSTSSPHTVVAIRVELLRFGTYLVRVRWQDGLVTAISIATRPTGL
jgi:hypothetical protein